jgi:SHS2 domain-containing protein
MHNEDGKARSPRVGVTIQFKKGGNFRANMNFCSKGRKINGMQGSKAGFREIEHTADWELEVWAPDLPGLLKQAALGMYSLADVQLEVGPRQKHSFEIEAVDRETLLVNFLSEILYYGENKGLGFDVFNLGWDGNHLSAHLEGARIQSIDKEIKAVTWHNLQVQAGEKGLEARIVFDV